MLTLVKPSAVKLTPSQLLRVILETVLEGRITDEEIERICALYYDANRKGVLLDRPRACSIQNRASLLILLSTIQKLIPSLHAPYGLVPAPVETDPSGERSAACHSETLLPEGVLLMSPIYRFCFWCARGSSV
jgi:hypothetical protein